MGFLSLQNIVLGLIEGGIYGLLAVGIVLVYRGSRVLNFAQGEIGTIGLFVAWFLVTDRGYPWPRARRQGPRRSTDNPGR